MASLFSKLNDELDLEAQVARLNRELATLKKAMTKRGSAAYADGRETAADLYDDLRERLDEAMPHIRKGARNVERAARDNPAVTAAVALGVIGLLAALLSRR